MICIVKPMCGLNYMIYLDKVQNLNSNCNETASKSLRPLIIICYNSALKSNQIKSNQILFKILMMVILSVSIQGSMGPY